MIDRPWMDIYRSISRISISVQGLSITWVNEFEAYNYGPVTKFLTRESVLTSETNTCLQAAIEYVQLFMVKTWCIALKLQISIFCGSSTEYAIYRSSNLLVKYRTSNRYFISQWMKLIVFVISAGKVLHERYLKSENEGQNKRATSLENSALCGRHAVLSLGHWCQSTPILELKIGT